MSSACLIRVVGPIPVGETQLRAVAEHVALLARSGDVIAIEGELGAGKTTFARALIRALIGDDGAEVPSPTFPLLQGYETPRYPVAHLDLYRLDDATGLDEIGLEAALDQGLVLIEWPDRAAGRLPADRLVVRLAEADDPEMRELVLAGHGCWAERVARIEAIADFLERAGWGAARVRYLQGDASARRYARLARGAETVLLMDSPRQPDGPSVRDGLPYSRIAHLAEDVRPFVAIAGALRGAGFSAPAILAHDMARGLLLIEDLGDRVFGVEMLGSTPQPVLWRAAVDVLVAMRRMPVGGALPLPDGTTYALPRFNRAALEIEIELLLDWYWPEVKGGPVPARLRVELGALWSPVLDRLMVEPPGWFLRDFHSPNLIWLPERAGLERVGIIDFQDALAEPWAFDLVSLLQDARVDVAPSLEAELLDHYCAEVERAEPGFDRARFAETYAAFGAQRNTRLVGLWVRLLRRDGKPGYLQHMARTWGYLERNLAHPSLARLRDWYDRHLPPELRRRTITA
jgi:hypothetical protein